MRDLFQVVFELKQKEIDDALRKMDKDKRVINSYKQLLYNPVSSTKEIALDLALFQFDHACLVIYLL